MPYQPEPNRMLPRRSEIEDNEPVVFSGMMEALTTPKQPKRKSTVSSGGGVSSTISKPSTRVVEKVVEKIVEKKVVVHQPARPEEINSKANELVQDELDKLRINFYNFIKGNNTMSAEQLQQVEEVTALAEKTFQEQVISPLATAEGKLALTNPVVAKTYTKALSELNQSKDILSYGSSVSEKPGILSNKILNATYLSDLDKMATPIAELISRTRETNLMITAAGGKTFWSRIPVLNKLFYSVIATKEKAKLYFESAGSAVKTLTTDVEKQIPYIRGLYNQLEDLYTENENIYYETTGFIEAGIEYMNQKNSEFIALEQAIQINPEDEMKKQSLINLRNQMDTINRRIYDLRVLQTLCVTNAEGIRCQKATAQGQIEKFHALKTIMVPAWNMNIGRYVISLAQQKSLLFAKQVRDATNNMLSITNQTVNSNMIEAQRQLNESVVSIEVLQESTDSLISSLEEIKQLQIEGRNQIIDNHRVLIDLQNNIKNKTVELSLGYQEQQALPSKQ